jgi:hypothetical protein
MYTDEEKKSVKDYMAKNKTSTCEECRQAGVLRGLFANRKAKSKSSLHSHLMKKK